LVVGDLNGDSVVDVVATTGMKSDLEEEASVTVLLGLGDGRLARDGDYVAGRGVCSPMVADFNQDGVQDIAVVNGADGTVSTLTGVGDGSFQAARHYGVNGDAELAAVADFNGDGSDDFVISYRNHDQPVTGVAVFMGSPSGRMAQGARFDSYASRLASADFDGDSLPDIVAGDDTMETYLSNGNGTFQPAITSSRCDSGGEVTTGDINQDGIMDVVSCEICAEMGFYLGNGDGTFTTVCRRSESPMCGDLELGLVDGDSIPDLVTADIYGGINFLKGNGDGTFQPFVWTNIGDSASAIALGDFNGDGLLDVVYASGPVCLLEGNGDGTFQPPVSCALDSIDNVIAADFNKDGFQDVMCSSGHDQRMFLLFGKGDGTFEAPRAYFPGNVPSALGAGDFNGDGELDVVVANLKGRNAGVFLADPDGLDDSDGDGILDHTEGSGDTDGDGIPDRFDFDSDNGGIPDSVEGDVDTDGDGAPDFRDPDSDGDGVWDLIEGNDADHNGVTDCPVPDADNDGRIDAIVDADGDGLDDRFDPDQGGTPAAVQDTDGDGTPDFRDPDDDDDGLRTVAEDANRNGNRADDDADRDGIPDYLDVHSTDSDGDGWQNAEDPCPDTPDPYGAVGNTLRVTKAGGDVLLDWSEGALNVRQYNVHRTNRKEELQDTGTGIGDEPTLDPPPSGTENYSDPDAQDLLDFYEVFGRDCLGRSMTF
jgi:hypothetical protein